jgi:glucose/arabinose dehydrogenase
VRGAASLLLVGLLALGSAPAGARPTAARYVGAAVKVRVTAREFAFTFTRKSVPVTTVRFVVMNAGAIGHDFVIAGRKTPVLAHAQRATLIVRFRKAGAYAFRCSVPGHAAAGMRGVLLVGKPASTSGAPPPPPPPQPPPAPTGVTLTKIGTFVRPVEAVAPPGDTHRLFVVEQTGVIRLLVDGVLQDRSFLDISDLVYSESETGLLSLAFAPDYATSGRFYVYYNTHRGNHDVDIVEFRRSAGDPDVADRGTERLVLTIVKPWENHNGGMMEFGPDGHLYVSVGDGDSGVLDPPGVFAQPLDDLLGKILRIDPTLQTNGAAYGIPPDNPFVGVAGARPEIWAYGLRNPWRFDINPANGDLYIGDVGEGAQEEIDVIPGGHGGENLGWPCFEGTAVFDAKASCANAVPPVLSYEHTKGCAVIGGVIARDPRLPQLAGRFLYGDLCTGALRSLLYQDGKLADDASIGPFLGQVMAWGEDALGRIYVSSLADRSLYRLDPVTPRRAR